MFTKTQILLGLALAWFTATGTARAELLLKGTQFAPLQPVAGASGKTVAVRATLYGKYYDTVTRKWWLQPLRDATITFEAYRKTSRNGTALTDWGPVGRVVKTDAEGVATTTYKLPAGVKKKLHGRYQATFAGGVLENVLLYRNTSRAGDVIVNP